jgi:hypothetical protein
VKLEELFAFDIPVVAPGVLVKDGIVGKKII